MALLASAYLFLPPPSSWGELGPTARAVLAPLGGATIAGCRVLRVQYSIDDWSLVGDGSHLRLALTLTLDGNAAADDLCGLYEIGQGVLEVRMVSRLPEPNAETFTRLDPATAAIVRASFAGSSGETPIFRPVRSTRSGTTL